MKCPLCKCAMVLDYVYYNHGDAKLKIQGYECTNKHCSQIIFDKEAAIEVKSIINN